MLFDDGGYVVARSDAYANQALNISKLPAVMEREPIENAHLSHREPSLAIYLLQNAQFMRKINCRQVHSDTIERRYRVNVTYADAIRVRYDSYISRTVSSTFFRWLTRV